MDTNDLALWARWQRQGDADAFKELALRHGRMVYATCLRILGNSADAEEVAQECFEAVARATSGPKSHVAAWLHAVAVSRSINRQRSEGRRRAREDRYAAEAPTAAEGVWNDIYEHVDAALAELPESYRVPILLHFFENRTHDSIAEDLGLTRSGVTRRIRRGIERLRRSLAGRGALLTSVALAAALGQAARADAAFPAVLGNAVAKLALAGPAPATGTAATVGAILLAKKLLLAAGVVLLAGTALWGASRLVTASSPEANAPARTESAAVTAAASEPAVPRVAPSAPSPAETAAAAQPDAPGTGSVWGRIFFADTGAPGQDLVVFLHPVARSAKTSPSAKADGGGGFRIGGASPGRYRVLSSGDGLPAQDPDDAPVVDVRAGETVKGVELAVMRGIVVSGRVVNEQGAPAAGIEVKGTDFRNGDYVKQSEGTTDAQGRFELCGFSPTAGFYLTAQSPYTHGGPRPYVSDIYGPVKLTGDGLSDVELNVYPGAVLTGRVVDLQGRPVAGAGVSVAPEPQPMYAFQNQVWVRDNPAPDGSFTLTGVPAGQFRLMALPEVGNVYLRAAAPWDKFRVARSQRIDNVTLVIDTSNPISGSVVDDDGRPVAGADVQADLDGKSLAPARTGKDGRYAIYNVKEGAWRVTVLNINGTLIADRDFFTNPRENVAPGSQADFVLRMKTRAAVEGRCVAAATGEAIPEFEILARGTAGYFRDLRSADFTPFKTADGTFSLSNVPVGAVELVVRAPGFAELRHPIEEVRIGETVRGVELALSPGSTVEGVVTNAAGEPVGGALVFAGPLPKNGSTLGRQSDGITDGEGRFSLENVPATTSVVSAWHDDYPVAEAPVQLSAGKVASVTLVMPEGAVLEGRITAGGQPSEGSSVQVMRPGERGATATTGPDGTYRVAGLQSGDAYVSVMDRMPTQGGGERRATLKVVALRQGETERLDVDFPTGSAALEGRVVRPEGAAGPIRIGLVEPTANIDMGELTVGPDGSFRFENLPPGPAELRVQAEPGHYHREPVELVDGQTTPCDINLADGTAVEGKVTGLPEGATPRILVLSGDLDAAGASTGELKRDLASIYPRIQVQLATKPDGTFRIAGLAPGRYTIVVTGGISEQTVNRPVDVVEGQSVQLDLPWP